MTEAAELPDIGVYRRYIEEALTFSGGTHDYDDVVAMVAADKAQFWAIGPDAFIVTEIVEHPRKRVLHFFLAGGGPGSLAALERATEPLLEWGKAKGCTSATLTGRRGWEKTFITRTGWAPKLVVFERNIADG